MTTTLPDNAPDGVMEWLGADTLRLLRVVAAFGVLGTAAVTVKYVLAYGLYGLARGGLVAISEAVLLVAIAALRYFAVWVVARRGGGAMGLLKRVAVTLTLVPLGLMVLFAGLGPIALLLRGPDSRSAAPLGAKVSYFESFDASMGPAVEAVAALDDIISEGLGKGYTVEDAKFVAWRERLIVVTERTVLKLTIALQAFRELVPPSDCVEPHAWFGRWLDLNRQGITIFLEVLKAGARGQPYDDGKMTQSSELRAQAYDSPLTEEQVRRCAPGLVPP